MESQKDLTFCAECGAHAVRVCADPIPVELREGTYYVEGFEHDHCDACGEDYIWALDIDRIQIAAVEMARTHLDRMSSEEIHEMRLSLGLTQANLERQIGVASGTVGRWERGEVLQSRMADKFMRLLWAHPQLLEESGSVAREGRGPYRKRAKE